ncbi:hypothetical protein ACFQV8_21050 [Pseudonocardia benzenivorans]
MRRRPGARPGDHLRRAERLLDSVFPILPTVAPVAGAGFVGLGLARLLARGDLPAADVHEVLRSLPHNVTTEMDLRLWALAATLRDDPASVAALRDREPAALAAAFGRGELPGRLQGGLGAFLTEHGHRRRPRSTSVPRAGPTTRRRCSRSSPGTCDCRWRSVPARPPTSSSRGVPGPRRRRWPAS